jgi:glucose-1-phosphate adenylyltransferase
MGAEIERSVVGIRSRIGPGTRLRDTLVLGADHYESLEDLERAHGEGLPPLGISAEAVIERAIIDKGARIGRGVRILNEAGVQHADGNGYYIREGIVVVPKGGVIPDGTVI